MIDSWSWKHQKISFFFVALLAVALFLARLGFSWWAGPHSLNQDEAAILMNARFLAESGRDEWGKGYPLSFASFGDAKLPGMMYLVAGFGKIIGFSAWTVRLPSLIAGSVLPFLMFFLVRNITQSRRVASLAALFTVLSPWSWHYSVVGFEAHVGLALFLVSAALFTRKQSLWPTHITAAACLFLSILTYNSPLILAPWIVLCIGVSRWPSLSRMVRPATAAIVAIILAALITLPATAQKTNISLFQNPTLASEYPSYREQFTQPLIQKLMGNKWVYFSQVIGRNIVSSFSWNFLVQSGGENPWHTIPHRGHVHFLIPLAAALGLGSLVRMKKPKTALLLFSSLLISLVPASITIDAPHATRSLFFFVMLTMIAALTLDQAWRLATQPLKVALAVLGLLGFLYWFFPARSLWQTYADPRWNSGLEEVIKQAELQSPANISVLDPHGTLYPFVVNATNLSYSDFQTGIRRSPPDTVGLVRGEKLGKYFFIFSPADAQKPGVLLLPTDQGRWDIMSL